MENPLRKQIRSIMKDHKKRQMWYRIVTTLAVVVVFVTTYMLILPAITMENKAECGITEHKHDANCYSSHYEKEKELACTTDSLGVHKHTDACYDAEHKLICGYADFVIHEHDASCYDKDGNLVCTIPEHKLHQHTPECYQMQKQLVCTQEESVGHTHTPECYTKQQGALICGKEEHTHGEGCYDAEGNLICTLEEHTHSDECYEWNDVLTCTIPESAGHTHSEACYSLKVIFNDIKEVAAVTKDSIVTVDYTATLNSNAVIGLDGNPNEVKLIFSNNPNMTGDGTGKPTDTGETPIDKVIVFTYELDVEKVDGTENTKKLAYAEFVLKRNAGENTEYAVVTNGKLEKWVDSIANATKLVTGVDGLVKVEGLDDGTYYLEETKAPSTYNKLSEDVTIVISASTVNNQTWNGTASDALTKIDVTANGEKSNGNVNDGSVKVTVENNQGSTLPSTGGMGTTIFYVVGSILVLGAAILLITKKRMSAR